MRIIVELCSADGYLKSMDIDNVNTVFPKDNVRIKESPPQDVIICGIGLRQKTIGFFSSTKQRDGALNLIRSRSSDTVVLDYNDWFNYEAYDDEGAIWTMKNHLGNFQLWKHFKFQLERKLTIKPEETDAFKDFGILFVEAMREEKAYIIDETEVEKYSRLWAKCIFVPGVVTRLGVSPRQYFKYLIEKNNEKFSK